MLGPSLALALLLVPPAAPAPAPAAPAQAPRIVPPLGDVGANTSLHALRRTASPKVNALVVATLRRFVEGTRNPTALDTAVARRLDKVAGAKAAAKRILGRVDALSAQRKTEVFGGNSTRGAVSAAQWTTAISAGSGLINGGVGVTPPDLLPSEALPKPDSYDVTLTGVGSTAATDPDGADELVVMTTFVRVLSTTSYSTTTVALPESGSIDGLAADTTLPQAAAVYSAPSNQPAGLVVTAAFEVDGDTAAMREEYVAMLALADVLAVQAEGDASVEDFTYGLDYTLGLLHISDPTDWPGGTLQRTVLTGDTSLLKLWATPSVIASGVPWKIKHEHAIGAAKYTVYFDVPAPPVVMPRLTVRVTDVESIDGVDNPDADDLRIRVTIGNEGKTKVLAENDDDPSISWPLQRQIKDTPHAVTIQVWDVSPGPESGWTGYTYCGDMGTLGNYAPCPPILTSLVLRGASDKTIDIAYDPKTKTYSGDLVGSVGQSRTTTGTGGKRGKIKLTITQSQE